MRFFQAQRRQNIEKISVDRLPPKNYLKTKHFISSALATLAGIVIAVYPSIENLIIRNTNIGKENMIDIGRIIQTVAGILATGGSCVAMHDRVTNQYKTYTPRGIFGHNLEDLLDDDDVML